VPLRSYRATIACSWNELSMYVPEAMILSWAGVMPCWIATELAEEKS